MLSWVGVVVSMLASPHATGDLPAVSQDVLSPTLVAPGRPEPTSGTRVWGWVSSLAVVRTARGSSDAPSSMVIFVTVAPVGRAAGVLAIGSF